MMRSRKIILTILASASLMAGGCSEEIETRRDIYASKEKCAEDWNGEECEGDGGGRYHGPHYFYSGGYPHYYSRMGGSAGRVPETWGFAHVSEGGTSRRAVGSTVSHISRGGFGKSAGLHGSLSA